MRFATASDVARIEEICNDPRIRLWTAFDGAPPCRGEQYVAAPSFTILGEEGCFLVKHMEEQRYCFHTNLLPHCRGAKALAAAREALRMAFLHTDCRELVTMVPGNMPHAALMARLAGLRQRFERPNIWLANGVRFGMAFYGLTLEEWICIGSCVGVGHAFHARLHGELGMPAHPQDPVHDAFVGAAVEMIRAGQLHKAVATYNRFARFAFYEPVRIVSEEPLRIDIAQCVLRVEGEEFHLEESHA